MKLFLRVVICLALLTSTCTPLGAYAKVTSNVDTIINEAEIKYGIDLKVVKTLPDNVTSKKFDTWDEAFAWLNQINTEIKNQNSKVDSRYLMYTTSSTPGLLHDGFEIIGEIGSCGYAAMPTGTGSVRKYNSYSVPGASAQTVDANYYFEFRDKTVTTVTGDANISGIGLATYSVTYNELEQYGPFFAPNFYKIIRGNLGYYITVGGVNIGYYQVLELDYCLYNSVGGVTR